MKDPASALFTAEMFTNEHEKDKPEYAVKSIKKWKLSGGDKITGTNEEWKCYYNARVKAEAAEGTHGAVDYFHGGYSRAILLSLVIIGMVPN